MASLAIGLEDTPDICLPSPSRFDDRPLPPSNLSEPISGSGPLHLAIDKSLMWQNGSNLRVRILYGGTKELREKIKQYALIWTKYANIKFTFVDEGDAEIRVAITSVSSGSFSELGSKCLGITNQKLPTMQLGLEYAREEKIQRTTLHEFGHALGCVHEHQGPAADIKWNEEYVINYHIQETSWDEKLVRHNIFNRQNAEQTIFDKDSIMVYPFPKEWTTDGFHVELSLVLSTGDKEVIRKMYPPQSNDAGIFTTPRWEFYPMLPTNQQQIQFSHEYAAPPRVTVGINALDIGTGADVRISTTAGRVKTDNFVIHVDTWADTTLYSGSATWFKSAEDDHDFQVGSFNTKDIRPWDKPEKLASKRIDFDHPFDVTPNVVIWLNYLDIDKDHHIRVKAHATGIDKKGFTIHIDAGSNSVIHSAGASWIAWRSGRTSTYSGFVDTLNHKDDDQPEVINGESVNFPPGTFGGAPKVFLGVNRIHFDNKAPLHFEAFASDVSSEGMKWNVNCREGTICYGAGASYLAFE